MINKWIKLLMVSMIISNLVIAFDEKQLGYYAFDKADRNNVPPRIRPPPYMQTATPCSGIHPGEYLENKDTLCGDLKRGFIPLNPMNIIIQNQHYPFELIKNKTLHFLAKTLPYLKEDHENIPKVFKISQSGFNELYSNLDPALNPSVNYRVKRQATRQATITKLDKTQINSNESETIKKNQQEQNVSNVSLAKKSKGVDEKDLVQESRQKGCEQKDGILCHIMQVLTANSKSKNDLPSLLNTFYQTYYVFKGAKDVGNFFQSLTNPLDKSDNSNEKNDAYAPILGFNSMNPSTTISPSEKNQNSNSYNPLGALLEYFGSSNGALSSRKKKPIEDFMNNGGLIAASSLSPQTLAVGKAQDEVGQRVRMAQLTPTACPSIEEYVTPVYARNYQGIWKYVVQIPHEGYYTQTIQKTNCVKQKCDYMDGHCKEASRWVSLLVAEVYYPNAKQPLSNMIPQSSQIKPTIYNDLNEKMNIQSQNLPTAFSPNDQNVFNYEQLFNSLVPNNFNEYNHYDQTFARRASKNHQPINQITNQPTNQKINSLASSPLLTSNSYSMPQYQEFNLNNNQVHKTNYNQQQQYSTINNKQQVNQPHSQTPNKAQLQKLMEFYQQQQYLQQIQQQLSKSARSNNGAINNAIYNSMINNLSSGSIMHPTIVSQSSSLNQQVLSNQQNDFKPRSFDTANTDNSYNMPESSMMKSSFSNKNDELMADASSDHKMISNDQIMNSNNHAESDSTHMNANINGNIQPVSNNQNANEQQNENNSPKENNEECDGYDSNGCFVIRVYYDWFLVAGSCKCWRTNSKTGSLETLKKIFIGK